MSINAEYVAVSPEELDDLLAERSHVLELFPFAGTDTRRRVSIDKAWHGVHFLLTGSAEDTDGELGTLVLGGEEVGDDEGYGPARVFTADQVAALARDLGDLDVDALAGRYDGDRMTELSIYPGGWDVDASAQTWLLDATRELRGFFLACADDGAAVVTLLT